MRTKGKGKYFCSTCGLDCTPLPGKPKYAVELCPDSRGGVTCRPRKRGKKGAAEKGEGPPTFVFLCHYCDVCAVSRFTGEVGAPDVSHVFTRFACEAHRARAEEECVTWVASFLRSANASAHTEEIAFSPGAEVQKRSRRVP